MHTSPTRELGHDQLSSLSLADGQLDGRQKKKYLSKIVFTYILGYDVDVGHMEAVNLISSPKYSEKQIVRTASTSISLICTNSSDCRATWLLRC